MSTVSSLELFGQFFDTILSIILYRYFCIDFNDFLMFRLILKNLALLKNYEGACPPNTCVLMLFLDVFDCKY